MFSAFSTDPRLASQLVHGAAAAAATPIRVRNELRGVPWDCSFYAGSGNVRRVAGTVEALCAHVARGFAERGFAIAIATAPRVFTCRDTLSGPHGTVAPSY